MSDCVKRLIEKSNGVFNKDEARKLLKDVEAVAKRKAEKGFDYDDAVKDTLAGYAAEMQINLQKERLVALRNMSKGKNLDNRVQNLWESSQKNKRGKLDATQAAIADIQGTRVKAEGSRASAFHSIKPVEYEILGGFLGEMEKGNLLEIWNSGKLEKEISNELAILEGWRGEPSNSKQAKDIAKIVSKYKEYTRNRVNQAGADIDKLDGHVMHQSYDASKLKKMGIEQFTKDFLEYGDLEKSFAGTEDMTGAIQAAYKAITTGIRLDNPLAVKEPKLYQFTGPANLGKKLSRSRKMFFKDANAQYEFNLKYGKTSFSESVPTMFSTYAKDIALMERYGTNPEAAVKASVDRFNQKNRDKLAASGKDPIDTDRVMNAMRDLVGSGTYHPNAAEIGGVVRAYQNVRLLGKMLAAQLGDIPNKAITYQQYGKSPIDSYIQPFLDIGRGITNAAELRNMSTAMGVFTDSMTGRINRFSGFDNASVKARKVERMYFKLTLSNWWNDTQRGAFLDFMSHRLAAQKDTAFKDLTEMTQLKFSEVNITEKDWDGIRTAIMDIDGKEYVLPELIENQSLREKLILYYNEGAHTAIMNPGLKEQRIAAWRTDASTWEGQIVRTIMQFKTFPIGMVTEVWGRALYSKGKLDVPMMLQLLTMTAAFGYLSGAASDLMSGRKPKDPMNYKTIMAAYARGGGLSIAGDLAFGTKKLSDVLVGPTIGQATDIIGVGQQAIQGKDDIGAKAARQTINSITPNLFYVRPAIDYLWLYQLQEQMNPGYLRRQERQMKKEYGQEYWLRPKN